MTRNEKLAEQFISAIRTLAEDEDKLDNFESYLSHHFTEWFRRYCTTPSGLVSEFCNFAEIKFDGRESEVGSPEAFYTGGGIWISAMYVDENIYYAIDNDFYEDSFCIYDHRGEDQDSDFPCQNAIGFMDYCSMSAEEKEIYRKLKKALDKEVR